MHRLTTTSSASPLANLSTLNPLALSARYLIVAEIAFETTFQMPASRLAPPLALNGSRSCNSYNSSGASARRNRETKRNHASSVFFILSAYNST